MVQVEMFKSSDMRLMDLVGSSSIIFCTLAMKSVSLVFLASSLDLGCNPCDYFLCSYLETMTNRTSHNIKASLIIAIEAGIRDIPAARLKNAYARFRSRQEQLLAANGGYFK